VTVVGKSYIDDVALGRGKAKMGWEISGKFLKPPGTLIQTLQGR